MPRHFDSDASVRSTTHRRAGGGLARLGSTGTHGRRPSVGHTDGAVARARASAATGTDRGAHRARTGRPASRTFSSPTPVPHASAHSWAADHRIWTSGGYLSSALNLLYRRRLSWWPGVHACFHEDAQ